MDIETRYLKDAQGMIKDARKKLDTLEKKLDKGGLPTGKQQTMRLARNAQEITDIVTDIESVFVVWAKAIEGTS